MTATTIRINLTDEQGILLGSMDLTAAELAAARKSPVGAQALVDELASQAGVR